MNSLLRSAYSSVSLMLRQHFWCCASISSHGRTRRNIKNPKNILNSAANFRRFTYKSRVQHCSNMYLAADFTLHRYYWRYITRTALPVIAELVFYSICALWSEMEICSRQDEGLLFKGGVHRKLRWVKTVVNWWVWAVGLDIILLYKLASILFVPYFRFWAVLST